MQASDDHRTWCGVQERLSCRCIAKELGADINYPRSYACVSAHSSVKLVVCAGRCTCRSRSIGLLWVPGSRGVYGPSCELGNAEYLGSLYRPPRSAQELAGVASHPLPGWAARRGAAGPWVL